MQKIMKQKFVHDSTFFFLFIYHEVYKLDMVTAHIKNQSNTQKRIELAHVICWTQTSSNDEKLNTDTKAKMTCKSVYSDDKHDNKLRILGADGL